MLENNFSHIPVVDDNKLVGIVTAKDIVRNFITPIGAKTVGDVIGKKLSRFSGTLNAIMDENPVTVGPNVTVKETTEKMLEMDASAVILLTDDKIPIAIITPRELLSVVLELRGKDEMPIYITGLQEIGDFMERAVIEGKIRRVMTRVVKIHPHLAEVSIHIQTTRKRGNRSLYEISVNVISKATKERFAFKREGWDVINIFDEVGDTLNRILTESKHEPRGMSKTQKRIKFALRDKPEL
jgi:predicted transcriptional regulator